MDQSKLKYGKICKKGHIGPNGYNVRDLRSACMACQKTLPDGPFTHLFPDITLYVKQVYASKEESIKAHIARVRAWQKKNPKKVKAYQKKYNESIDWPEWYANRTPEQKEKILADAREYSKNDLPKRRARYANDEEYRNEIKRKQRETYASRTPEQIAYSKQWHLDYSKRKKAEKDES